MANKWLKYIYGANCLFKGLQMSFLSLPCEVKRAKPAAQVDVPFGLTYGKFSAHADFELAFVRRPVS